MWHVCLLLSCSYPSTATKITHPNLTFPPLTCFARQHGTIEEIIKHLDAKKYPVPDDWLEPSERAEKRKQARQEAKARKEARAKEEAKMKAEIVAKSEVADEDAQNKGGITKDVAKTETEKKEETDSVAEEGTEASVKREREAEKDIESDEELDDTPPMYRQARGLFLKPEVSMAFWLSRCEIAVYRSTRSQRLCTWSTPPCYRFFFGPPITNMQVEPAGEYKLKWTDPDEPGLIKFLVEEKGYVRTCFCQGLK